GGRARSRHPRDHRARDQRAAGARRERAARARALRHRDRAGDPRDAHRDVAADAARRDAAPAVRPDDTRAPLVARALAPEKLLGRDGAAERWPRDPRRRRLPDRERPAARGPRPRGARPSARARGWTSSNYAAIACLDFPTCQGQWWPHTDYRSAFALSHPLNTNYEGGVLDNPARTAIHVTHRLGALIAAAALTLAALHVLRHRGGLAGARLRAWA